MKIRQKMKHDVATLKKLIKDSNSRKEKFENIMSLILKDISIVGFAIIFISVFNQLFGTENSAAAVVIFCILMFVKSVNFGYNMKSSIISLFLIFFNLTFGPYLSSLFNPFVGFIINIISVGIIVLLGCQQPIYGSAGLFLFGYVFIYSNPVSSEFWTLRIMEMALGFLICALIFYISHKDNISDNSLREMIKDFSPFEDIGKYHIQVILGLSISIFVGEIFKLPRILWVGCACMSVVNQYGKKPKERFIERIIGVIIGSCIFTIIYLITPPGMRLFLGIFSGLCLGLCSTYRWSTAFNSFGALLIATEIYGLQNSIFIRISNNIIGCIFGFIFYYIFHKVMEYLEDNHGKTIVNNIN